MAEWVLRAHENAVSANSSPSKSKDALAPTRAGVPCMIINRPYGSQEQQTQHLRTCAHAYGHHLLRRHQPAPAPNHEGVPSTLAVLAIIATAVEALAVDNHP